MREAPLPEVLSLTRKPTAAALKRLYATAWWTLGRDDRGIRSVLLHSDVLATAWSGGELVGFARASTDFAYRAVLWDVIVHPRLRRRGLGTRLVRAILGHPRLAGVESFWLFTTDQQPFYRSLGFKGYPRNVLVWRKAVPPRAR